jgi:uncharacterized protein (DUF433 family)
MKGGKAVLLVETNQATKERCTAEEVYTLTEAAAFAGVSELDVRKQAEQAILGPDAHVGFDALVYLRATTRAGLELGIEDRVRILRSIHEALKVDPPVESIEVSELVLLRIGSVIRQLHDERERFLAWKRRLVTDPAYLGGEAVFPDSRLAVRQVGAILKFGSRAAADDEQGVREDYPYLSAEDLEFARIYARAYPLVSAGSP